MTRILLATRFVSRADEIARALPRDEVIEWKDGADVPDATDVEAAVGPNDPVRARAIIAALPRLRWYHTVGAGVDRLLVPEIVENDALVLTNNSGAYDVPIAEHVMATIFAAAKHLPHLQAAQQRHEWVGDPHDREIRGATLVILGMGSIGGELAKLAEGVRMRVVGIRRTARDGALAPDDLREAAMQADYLAVCAPLTEQTRGIVSADVIARLPAHAWVINIARGQIVDESALLRACREGRIGGAAIDAWWQEPLPADSEWWGLTNVIVTPHVSFSSERVRERTVELIVENVRRFKAGAELLNVVDKQRGY
jgi:phosphoglycerate dehydrogenase-like enzyme